MIITEGSRPDHPNSKWNTISRTPRSNHQQLGRFFGTRWKDVRMRLAAEVVSYFCLLSVVLRTHWVLVVRGALLLAVPVRSESIFEPEM